MNELKMEELFEERFFDDKDKYYAVIAFWKRILKNPNRFNARIHDFSNEIGFGAECYGCNFPSIFDSPDEEGYFEEGVEFWYGYENVDAIVIDYAMFVKCIELVYSIYSEKYGINEEIERDIEYMHAKYSV